MVPAHCEKEIGQVAFSFTIFLNGAGKIRILYDSEKVLAPINKESYIFAEDNVSAGYLQKRV